MTSKWLPWTDSACLASVGYDQRHGGENASNPLAAVTNTDVRGQYFDLGGSDRWDFFLDGAYMLTPKLKLKFELHYWATDVTGEDERDWESQSLQRPNYNSGKCLLLHSASTWTV